MKKQSVVHESYYVYARNIIDKKILSCRYTQLACKRFLNDLKKSEQDGYPYYFDITAVDKTLAFIGTLQFWEGPTAGQPIILEPWESFIFANVYGWKHKSDKLRRFKSVFLFTARKNGKSLIASIFLLIDMLKEKGGQAYSISNSKKQAEISFNNVKQFVARNETLNSIITSYRDSLVYNPNASFCKSLSSDTSRLDGLNPSCAVLDEVAVYKDSKIIDLISSGQGARAQPLLILITTANFIQLSPGYLEYQRSMKILDGIILDEEYFTVLYQLDENDNWKDSKNYIKANPNLGVTIKEQDLIADLQAALDTPYKEREFRTKKIQCWLFGNEKGWISDEKWKRCQVEFDEDMLIGSPCTIAIDLSKRIDLTVYTLCFHIEKLNKYYLKHKIYIPQEQIEEKIKNDSHMFYTWIGQKFITPIPGEVINTDIIFEDLKKDVDKYNPRLAAYDPYMSGELIDRLSKIINTVEYPQNYKKMSEPTKQFEADVLNSMLVDNNPVMRWCISNAVASEWDNNIKIKKEQANSTKRIDPVITSIMALDILKGVIKDKPVPFKSIIDLF